MNKQAKRVTCSVLRNNAQSVCRESVASEFDRKYIIYFISSTFSVKHLEPVKHKPARNERKYSCFDKVCSIFFSLLCGL
jgi:hypothetical protein